jgi:hypothetical protein
MIRSIITAIRVSTKPSPTTANFRFPDNNGTVVAQMLFVSQFPLPITSVPNLTLAKTR